MTGLPLSSTQQSGSSVVRGSVHIVSRPSCQTKRNSVEMQAYFSPPFCSPEGHAENPAPFLARRPAAPRFHARGPLVKNIFLSLVCLLSLVLCPGTSQAEKITTDYYTVDMPDSWQKLQENLSNSISIYVYATKSRDCVVTTVIGNNGGADLETITSCFAQQYKSRKKPVVKNNMGTFSFKDTENEDGYAYITTQDALYMVVTASGNLRKARSFIKEFQSDDYKDLIPYL